ncbi:hypothetical protein BJH93_11085 [Kocuria polaris]|nr:hypothetical protein [Kocuria polaris]
MPYASFGGAELTTFARLEELGSAVVGQRLTAARAVLECRLVEEDPWCRAPRCSSHLPMVRTQ